MGLGQLEYTYDHLNRELSRTLPLGVASTDPHDFVERMWYDDSVVSTGESVGFGQLAFSVDFEGHVTKYLYDNTSTGSGRLVSKQHFAAIQNFQVSVSTTLQQVRDAVTGQTPARTIEYRYDAFGRNVITLDDGHGTTTNGFDADGRMILVASPEGYLHHDYDRAGRMTQTWTSVDLGGTNVVNATEYRFDVLGRMIAAETLYRNGTQITEDATRYWFDANGNLDQTKTPNDVVADYQYDPLNRLTFLRHFKDVNDDDQYTANVDEMLAEFEYTLREDGKRTRAMESILNGTSMVDQTFEWLYDELGRLTQEIFNGPVPGEDYIARYIFDLASNRHTLSKDLGNAIGTSFQVDEEAIYTVDPNDRLLQEVTRDGSGTLLRSVDYEYGGAGNPATHQTNKTERNAQGTATKITASTYDVRGRLSRIQIDDGANQSIDQDFVYQYNDSGIRISTRDMLAAGQPRTLYHIDPQNPTGYAQVIEEGIDDNSDGRLQVGEIDRSFTLGHDLISQVSVSSVPSAVYYFLYDGHGSTRALLDGDGDVAENPNGNVPQVFTYDAYGNPIGFTNNQALTNHLYSGQWTDGATGLQYLRARYYDPKAGRWNRLDDFVGNNSDPVSLHKYLYVHADPIQNIDPTGMFSIATSLSVGSIQGFIATGVNVVGTALRVYSTVQTVIDFLNYADFLLRLVQGFTQPTPQGAIATITNVLRQEFGNIELNDLVSGFQRTLETIGPNWNQISTAILREAPTIATMAADGARKRLQSYTKAQAEGRLRFVIQTPTAPGARSPDKPIPLGDNLELAVGLTGGRLFGLGVRTSKTNVDPLFRIDYWDGQRLPFNALHVHYHVIDNPHKHTIWSS